jgi:hypothetical protein
MAPNYLVGAILSPVSLKEGGWRIRITEIDVMLEAEVEMM